MPSRLRGGRPNERQRVWPRQSVRGKAQRDLQFGYRAFRCDRHARSVAEAYELVEDGHITADDFRDFTFSNRCGCGLWGTQNPKFFEGTRVAKQAAAVLAAAQASTLAAAE
jgi:hypothetical protein